MNILENIQIEFERRILGESFSRISKCVEMLTLEELWKRPNDNLVAAGNLILHLDGNVRQWIISAIGGSQDIRNRDLEFSNTVQKSKEHLLSSLKQTILEATGIIKSLSLASLDESRLVQGFDENVLSIIIHVIEHFSYHTGQITYFTKLVKNVDTGYYAGLDLNK